MGSVRWHHASKVAEEVTAPTLACGVGAVKKRLPLGPKSCGLSAG